MDLRNHANPFTIAATIFAIILIVAVPPLGMAALILAIASSRRVSRRTANARAERHQAARAKQSREKMAAYRALGRV